MSFQASNAYSHFELSPFGVRSLSRAPENSYCDSTTAVRLHPFPQNESKVSRFRIGSHYITVNLTRPIDLGRRRSQRLGLGVDVGRAWASFFIFVPWERLVASLHYFLLQKLAKGAKRVCPCSDLQTTSKLIKALFDRLILLWYSTVCMIDMLVWLTQHGMYDLHVSLTHTARYVWFTC